MKSVVGLKAVALPIGFAVLLSACGGGEATEPPSSSPTSTAPSAATSAPGLTPTAPATRVLTPTGVAVSATPRPAPTPTISTAPVPTEVADAVAFKKYFKEVSLAKLPVGKVAGPGSCPSPAKAFTAKDQLCMVFDVRTVPPATTDGIFDVSGATLVRAKTELNPPVGATGERVVCVPVTLPAGRYEYKLWVEDALVAVVPFEVK